jgi:hypothetical protein
VHPPSRPTLTHASEHGHVLLKRGTATLTIDTPILVSVLGHEALRRTYDAISPMGDGISAEANLMMPDGTHLAVTDEYVQTGDDCVRLDRVTEVLAVGTGVGVNVGLDTVARAGDGAGEDWQFYLPCTLYNRNDSDGDGVEDYFGVYAHDLRDDKNGVLAVLARQPANGATFSVARLSMPGFDTALTPNQLIQRYFVQETDIGSLGVAPRPDGNVSLRASYPFAEERSFSLDTSSAGWQAFVPVRLGRLFNVTYEFRIGTSSDFTDAVWLLCEHQRGRLHTRRPSPDVSLAEALEYRQILTLLHYRQWTEDENPRQPAGYLVHFSPRDGQTRGSLLEFGFSGAATLVAWAQLQFGYRRRVPLYRDRARKVLDFFVRHCQLENGYAHGIYDPIHDRFTPWFTGIMMPFQYANDEDDLRRFVGKQMVDALVPIARELRRFDGNYLRTMCESFYPLLLAYQLDAANGRLNESWLAAGQRFGDFLLDTQAEDGSWYRAYSPDGEGVTAPTTWFGLSYVEQKSGSIFPIPVLTTLNQITGDERYLDAIEKAAAFISTTYVEPCTYVGGLNDTTHVKSVKADAVSVMFAMRSLIKAYETLRQARWLRAAEKAAKILCSWVYLWDVPMPPETLLAKVGFKSTGWAGCDVIASGSYLDNEFLEFTADLMKVAEYCENESLFDYAELVEFGMQYALSTPSNDHGYVAPGIQCEGVLTSYWLSAPDDTAFSGAVNKAKGDDNDTCNALTNAQAAYGLYHVEDTYGTLDFDLIRARLFRR